MGNVPSLFHPTEGAQSCMPGCFPDEDNWPGLTPQPPKQGEKRKRSEGSPDGDRAEPEKLPSPKRLHTKQTASYITQSINEQNPLAPRAPIMSVRALEAPKRQTEPLRDYDCIRKLGESSEGKVYLMKSKKTAELLAVKVLKEKHHRDATRLPDDCRLHLNLKMHHHIVFLSQIDIVDNHIWQALSFENAGDLLDYARRREQHPLPAIGHRMFVVHLLIQMSEAFAFLHHGLRRVCKGQWEVDAGWSEANNAIIMGDCKPENILLCFSPANEYGFLPDVRIADFGHAALASSPLYLAGSPLYFSPEVEAADRGRRGPRMSRASDIYSFGLTMYNVITGKHLWTGYNTRFLTLPAEYHELGFTQLLVKFLEFDPRKRPTMDFEPEKGLLPEIDKAWDIRNELFWECKTGEFAFWKDWRKDCIAI